MAKLYMLQRGRKLSQITVKIYCIWSLWRKYGIAVLFSDWLIFCHKWKIKLQFCRLHFVTIWFQFLQSRMGEMPRKWWALFWRGIMHCLYHIKPFSFWKTRRVPSTTLCMFCSQWSHVNSNTFRGLIFGYVVANMLHYSPFFNHLLLGNIRSVSKFFRQPIY